MRHLCIWPANKQNEIQVIRNLIGHGAEVNVYNFIGETPLHLFVSQTNHLIWQKYLIQNGADLFAITTNQKELRFHGTNCILSASKQQTLLILLNFFLTNGADLEANSREKESTLHLAIAQNSIKLVQYSIKNTQKQVNLIQINFCL
ncbi:protein fem-1 [Anaeramoeba ignava]|uniref:Protein fem-1 n=1 Tax=Anaeramoeba ignava TaxID=1746090 RepID=A0A9Q0LWK4_ANAIG|nr:protein fem-1 [Anaeramoeba ignava]